MAGSLLLAAGLVTGAQYLTKPLSNSIAATPSPQGFNAAGWESTLEQIQLGAGISAPAPAPAGAVNELLTAAQSANLTETIGRSLLVRLSSANAEGLGTDIPTQEAIVAEAAAQVGAEVRGNYQASDLIRVKSSPESLRLYGNSFIETIVRYPAASAGAALFAFGEALDYQDRAKLAPLAAAEEAYAAIAADLTAVAVPETIAPLHLQVANNFAAMGKAAGEMRAVLDDPLRGLGGLQVFQSSSEEAERLFITIAGMLRNNGILFSKDDPGAAWSAFDATQ